MQDGDAGPKGSELSEGLGQPALPAPRLQLRWAEAEPNDRHYEWACHYELVIPLDEYDIRREDYDDDGHCTKGPRWAVVTMKPPSLRGSSQTPCQAQDGTRYYDPPYRDGVHAQWDAAVLGNPPIYVIAPDGTAFLRGLTIRLSGRTRSA